MRYLFDNPKRLLLVIGDSGLIALAYVSAYLLRFELTIPHYVRDILILNLPLLIVIRLIFLIFFGVYRGITRYASINDLKNITVAFSASSVMFIIFSRYLLHFESHPRSIYFIDLVLAVAFIGGSRLSIRMIRDFQRMVKPTGIPLLIVGAGDAGELLVREIFKRPEAFNYNLKGFVDDDPDKKGANIHGVPVLGSCEQIPELVQHKGIKEIIIAIPSASGKEMRRIVEFCKKADVKFKTIPSLAALVAGSIKINQIREVRIEDLLRRQPVALDTPNIRKYIQGKRIMVTGAGGSIGSELCRQVAMYKPEELILLERTENNLFYLNLELNDQYPQCNIAPLVGDIIDAERMKEIFKTHCPQVVFHAAAHKHVPLMEINPKEAIKNNVFGTLNLLEIADKFECLEEFIFISTDKAVNPTSFMGASKRLAEMLVTSFTGCNQTKFSAVRFGNVIGSEGSVLPLFKRQIEKGGPITVTHPEITRYFMTIPEAAQLVIQAGAMAKGGEIFVLDMGEPIKIVDLARDLITFSGLKPGEDIDVIYTGLRPGEKMYEELWQEKEQVLLTTHEKINYIIPENNNSQELLNSLRFLEEDLSLMSSEDLMTWIRKVVPEFKPASLENKE